MSQPPCRPRTPRAILFIALAATLGITLLSLTQCTMVPDNVTGVTMTPGRLSGRSACAKNCQRAYETALREENRRHQDALHACGSDASCRDAENQRHEALQDQIKDARRQCKKDCYNEGSGSGW